MKGCIRVRNRDFEWIALMSAFSALERQEAERKRRFGETIEGRQKPFEIPVPALVGLARRLTKRHTHAFPKPTS
jgi:hypothetical protein